MLPFRVRPRGLKTGAHSTWRGLSVMLERLQSHFAERVAKCPALPEFNNLLRDKPRGGVIYQPQA